MQVIISELSAMNFAENPEQFTFIARESKPEEPYQLLMASGHLHFREPHPMISALRGRFEAYIDRTAKRPYARVMPLEAGSLPEPAPEGLSDEELVVRGGEQLMLSEWARAHNIWTIRLEPQQELVIPPADDHADAPLSLSRSNLEVIQGPELYEVFAYEEVSFLGLSGYYGGRLIPQMVDLGVVERDEVEAYLDTWFEKFWAGWDAAGPPIDTGRFGLSSAGFQSAFRRIYNRPLEFPLTQATADFMLYETCSCLYPELYPQGASLTEVGRVAEVVNLLRDMDGWRIISQLWKKGWSPFLAPGESHVRKLGSMGMANLGVELGNTL